MSKWVLSKEENVVQDFVELGFVTSEKCQTGFCRKGNRRTGLLSQEEIVKPGFITKGNRRTGFCRKRKMSNWFCRKENCRVGLEI